MVQAARLVIGIGFLVLFAGFELHIPAIENLIPGAYAGLPFTGYIGFGFLASGLTSIATSLSTPSRSAYLTASPPTAGPPTMPDPATMAMAMAAMQQAQQMRASGASGNPVACPSCGAPNMATAKFCQACASPLSTGPKGPSAVPRERA